MSATIPEASPDAEKTRREIRAAEAFFVVGIARIVGDVSGLMAGADGFDYFVPVPASRLHEMSPRISDLQLDVQERFGISLTAMPIPYADKAR